MTHLPVAGASPAPVGPTALALWRRLERSPRLAALALGLGAALIFGATAGLWDLWGADEGRYAIVAKELLGRTNWFLLTLFGEPYDQKPPLPFWIWSGMIALSGGEISAWMLRLPSILFAAVAVVSTFWIGRARFGDRAGLISSLVLMTSAQFMSDAATVELNMMYTGWIALSLAAWLSRPDLERLSLARASLLWGALAGAFFTKGPLAIFIVLSVIVCEAASLRSWKILRAARPAAGLVSLALLIAAWLWAQGASAGAAFVADQVRGETVERFLSGSHDAPFWYYAPRLFTSIFAPWGVFLIPAGVMIWKGRRGRPAELDPILAWAILPLLFLTLANGKRQSYLLPLLPGMALVVGYFFVKAGWGRRSFPRWALGAVLSGALLSAAFLAAALATFATKSLAWQNEFYIRDYAPMWAVPLGLVAALAAVRLRGGPPTGARIFAGAAAFLLLLTLGHAAIVKPALNPRKTTRTFAEQMDGLLRERAAGRTLYAFLRAEKPEYHAYAKYNVAPILAGDPLKPDFPAALAQAKSILAEDPSRLFLVRGKDWPKVRAGFEAESFRPVARMTASGDPLVVLGREAGPSSAGAPRTVRFAALGDTGTGKNKVARLADQIAGVHEARPLDAVLLLGDNLYGNEAFPLAVKNRFEKTFAPLLEAQVPFFAALGNHDVRPGILEGELGYAPFNMHGRRYYSRSFGGGLATVFVLDSNALARDPEQVAWFRDALAVCESPWKIVSLHHPLQSSAISHGPDAGLYRLLYPLMRGEGDVDLVLSGHNHVYERRRVRDGILHVTAGCGGRTEEDFLPEDPERVAGFSDRLGFVEIEIREDRLEARTLDADGALADQFVARDLGLPPVMEVVSGPPTVDAASAGE